MKVAVATQDLTRIDAHLGWARHLLFFEVDTEGCRYLDMAEFPAAPQDGDHGKLEPRLAALAGCQVLFAARIGPEAEFGLARARVVPVCSFAGRPPADALDSLVVGLRERKAPWLRRAEQRYRRAEDNED